MNYHRIGHVRVLSGEWSTASHKNRDEHQQANNEINFASRESLSCPHSIAYRFEKPFYGSRARSLSCHVEA